MNHLTEALRNAYLDYTNDFLTVQAFAEYYALDKAQALQVIELGRAIHEQQVEMNSIKKTA